MTADSAAGIAPEDQDAGAGMADGGNAATTPTDDGAAAGIGAAGSTTGARRQRTRRATDRKIVQAVLGIATTKGVGAVSIEEVARVSGVAKTTIYRRYRDADDLLDSISTLDFVRSPQVEDLPPSRENLERLLTRLARRFDEGIGVKAVGLVLSSDNAFFRRILDQGIPPLERHLSEFFLRGEREGVFRKGLDVRLLFGTIIGSMIADRALSAAEARRIGDGGADAGSDTDAGPNAGIGAGADADATRGRTGGTASEAAPDADAGSGSTTWARRMADLLWPAITV